MILQRGLAESVIVAGTNHENFIEAVEKSGRPYVVLANNVVRSRGRPAMNQVRYDDYGGFCEAVRYLAQFGHQDIWYIGDNSEPWFQTRYEAYEKTMRDLHLEPRAQVVATSDDAFENGHQAVSLILEQRLSTTAIVAASEELAYGVKEGLRQHGRDVPRDVSLIGFDHETGRTRLPTMTSVCVDTVEVGRQLAKMAIARIEPDCTLPEVVVATRLVRRSSCRPLRPEPQMVL
jgi:DNA-binding LacI/PurR family transcriptional regulator